MKALRATLFLLPVLVASCNGWPVPPGNYDYVPPTALPTRTPLVQTATAVIWSPTPATATSPTGTPAASTETPTSTVTPAPPMPSHTPTPEPTPAFPSIRAEILGCDTGLDLVHGMGEVTNAYVTISNPGPIDAGALCATLSGLDEARPHPDKTRCIPSLPSGYQVTLKLTVDTTYRQATPIQVDVTSGEVALSRVGAPACAAIGTLLPDAGDLGVLRPIPAP